MGGPHEGQTILAAGEPVATAQAAMILVHGRGASAADIMTLGAELMHPGFAYLAPQAAGLWAISAGLSYNFPDDHEMLAFGMKVYDALYSWAKYVQEEKHTWKTD